MGGQADVSVLVVLGVIWAAVLIPPILRARAERRAEFIDSFQEQMGALGGQAQAGRALRSPTGPRARLRRPDNPVKRRRDIVGGLLGAMIGSLLLGSIPRLRVVLALHLFLLNLFLAYIALLAHQRGVAMRRQASLASSARQAPSGLGSVRHAGSGPERTAAPALAPALHTSFGARR